MDRLPDNRSAEELVRLAEEYAAFVETSYSPLLETTAPRWLTRYSVIWAPYVGSD